MNEKPTKEEIIQLQNKIIKNVIRHCKENNIDTNNLMDRCNLSKERIQEILDLDSSKIVTLAELYSLSKVIGIEFSEIFKIDKD